MFLRQLFRGQPLPVRFTGPAKSKRYAKRCQAPQASPTRRLPQSLWSHKVLWISGQSFWSFAAQAGCRSTSSFFGNRRRGAGPC